MLLLLLFGPILAAPPLGEEDEAAVAQGEATPAVDLEDVPLAPAPPVEGSPAVADERTPGIGVIPDTLLEIAVAGRSLPLPERMKRISDWMIDKPYVHDALGEGRGVDADPLARYDVFDCHTFVEEVLALSLSGDPAHAAQVRNALRYGEAERTYVNRRHFMELEWIPHNLSAGWLVDVTRDYGDTVRFENEFTPSMWAAWGRRSLFHHSDDQLPIGDMALDVLPLEAALAAVDRIRPGSIILTVRENRPWVPLWITHVGFTVPDDTRTTVRHASRMKASMRVRDHGLKWYLEHLQTYKHWKAAGISILEPMEPGPRQSRLD